MSQPELAFLHIPKTAGTSQHQLFNRFYGRKNVFWFGMDSPGRMECYPQDLVGEAALVGGHQPLSFYPPKYNPLYCAVTRDPVERAISLFAHYAKPDLARSSSGRQGREKMFANMLKQGMDPDSMLLTLKNCKAFRDLVENMQCSYLSRSGATFDGVLESLEQHDFVLGTLLKYAEFHQVISDLLAWPEEAPGVFNSGKANYARDYLDDQALTDLILELNTEDSKLYDFLVREHDGLLLSIRDKQQRQSRLKQLPPCRTVDTDQPPWVQKGMETWPLSISSKLPVTDSALILLEDYKLLYAPVPGKINWFITGRLLAQSGIENKPLVRELGMLRAIKRFNTGLKLGDHGDNRAGEILSDSSYFRFAVIQNPMERVRKVFSGLFSGSREGVLPPLAAYIAEIQGQAKSDLVTGVSFRQFVAHIVGRERDELVSALKPQADFLPDAGAFTRLYREDELWKLDEQLSSQRGLDLQFASAVRNKTAPASVGDEVGGSASLADIPWGEFPPGANPTFDQLADSKICEQLEHYYSEDLKLFNSTDDETTVEVVR